MKFSFDDQTNLKRLRIDLHPNCAPDAVKFCDAFNLELDQFEVRFNNYFASPSVDVMEVEFESLEEIARGRNRETLELLQAVVSLLSLRLEVHRKIVSHLKAAATAAREELRKVRETAHARLSQEFTDKAVLADAVNKTDAVKQAYQLERFHADKVAELNREPNFSEGELQKLTMQYTAILQNWVSAFIERRTREVDPNQAKVDELNERMRASIERNKSHNAAEDARIRQERDEQE